MIIRHRTVHEEVQVIPLLLKEGSEVLDPDSRAGAHRLPVRSSADGGGNFRAGMET